MALDPTVEWAHKRRESRQYLLLVLGAVVAIIGAIVAWWFLRSGQIGDECVTDENCVRGNICVFDQQMRGTCTVKCDSDADCPDSMTCTSTQAITDFGMRSFHREGACAPR
jgi:nitrogen fixation-related uncharacterized protein